MIRNTNTWGKILQMLYGRFVCGSCGRRFKTHEAINNHITGGE